MRSVVLRGNLYYEEIRLSRRFLVGESITRRELTGEIKNSGEMSIPGIRILAVYIPGIRISGIMNIISMQ